MYKDSEKHKQAKKNHYLRNREDYLERARKQVKSPEMKSKHNRTYYLKHREEILARLRLRDRTGEYKPKERIVVPEKPIDRPVETEAIRKNRERLILKSMGIIFK